MAAMSAANHLKLWDRIVDYADLLTDVWLLRGDYTRARRGLSWALKSAMELVLPTKRLSYLMRLGEVNFEQDRYEDAQVRFDQCVGLANELGSLERLAECRYWLGRTALESGQLERAREQLAESERLYLQLEEPIGLACVYYQQGQLCYDSDQAEQAKRLCTQALALQTEFEQSVHRIASLRLMADIEIELGDTVAAEQHCLQAQRLCAETNNAAEMAAVLHTLAVIARLQNQLDRAEEYNERALRRFKEMGLDGFTALSLYERSKIQAARNHGPAAFKTGLESLRIARGTGQIFNVVVVLNHLAKLCDRLDKQADALAYDREAVELAARHSHPMWEEIQARYRQRRQNPHKSG